MQLHAIHQFQSEKNIRSSLRKAAAAPNPPRLSEEETSMIREKFSKSKPVSVYTLRGDIHRPFADTGRHIDTRV